MPQDFTALAKKHGGVTVSPDEKALLAAYGTHPEDAPRSQSFSRNKQWSKAGPYSTTLSPAEEIAFRKWAATHPHAVNGEVGPAPDYVPLPNADYDIRGYWKAMSSGKAAQSLSEFDKTMHFPDAWKTPYDATFSNQSLYALPTAPHWVGQKLYTRGGQLIVDETPHQAGISPDLAKDLAVSGKMGTPAAVDYASVAKKHGGVTLPHPDTIKQKIEDRLQQWWKDERSYYPSNDPNHPGHSNADAAFINTIAAIPGYLAKVYTDASGAAPWHSGPEAQYSAEQLVEDFDPGPMIGQLYDQFHSDWKVDPGMAVQKLGGTLAALGLIGKIADVGMEAAPEVLKPVGQSFAESMKTTNPEGGFVEVPTAKAESAPKVVPPENSAAEKQVEPETPPIPTPTPKEEAERLFVQKPPDNSRNWTSSQVQKALGEDRYTPRVRETLQEIRRLEKERSDKESVSRSRWEPSQEQISQAKAEDDAAPDEEYKTVQQSLRQEYGEEWYELSDEKKKSLVESDIDQLRNEEAKEKQKEEERQAWLDSLQKRTDYIDEKQREAEKILEDMDLPYTTKGQGLASRYIVVEFPASGDETEIRQIRISDHAPPVGRGGIFVDPETGLTDYHNESDLSLHPGEDNIRDLEDFLKNELANSSRSQTGKKIP